MSIRLSLEVPFFSLHFSDETDAALTGPTATDVLREQPTASGSVVADLDLLQTVIERIFSVGMLLDSPRSEAASSAARIEMAIEELDNALVSITDAAFDVTRSGRTVPKVP